MPQNVKCEVNNCSFWGSGNMCKADEIFVISNTGLEAKEQKETDCHTFEPKH